MLKVENIVTPSPEWWQVVVDGTRNPMNSWNKSDSDYLIYENYWCDAYDVKDKNGRIIYDDQEEYDPETCHTKWDDERYRKFNFSTPIHHQGLSYFMLGEKDLKLLTNLANAGHDHGKFLRQLPIICEVTAPLYWWKQADKYQIGTVTNSCSTMHRLTEKPFELSDFSISNWSNTCEGANNSKEVFQSSFLFTLSTLNQLRDSYLKTNNKGDWQKIVELLPESYLQKRTLSLNYAVLRNMYHQRKGHKLNEWEDFLNAFKEIPYFNELIVGG